MTAGGEPRSVDGIIDANFFGFGMFNFELVRTSCYLHTDGVASV